MSTSVLLRVLPELSSEDPLPRDHPRTGCRPRPETSVEPNPVTDSEVTRWTPPTPPTPGRCSVNSRRFGREKTGGLRETSVLDRWPSLDSGLFPRPGRSKGTCKAVGRRGVLGVGVPSISRWWCIYWVDHLCFWGFSSDFSWSLARKALRRSRTRSSGDGSRRARTLLCPVLPRHPRLSLGGEGGSR